MAKTNDLTDPSLPRSERVKGSHQPRKHFKGRMGISVKVKGGTVVKPRAHTHGGHSQASRGFSCDDTKARDKMGATGFPTKMLPGRFRVQMPPNRTHYVETDPSKRAGR